MLCIVVLVIIIASLIAFVLEYPGVALKRAGRNTESLEKYSVMTSVILPDGTLNYLEVTTPNGNYTEIPYQASTSDYSYMLRDWLTTDGTLYELNPKYSETATTDEGKAVWLKTPKSYGLALKQRKSLYSDIIADGLFSSSKTEKTQMDLGTGEVTVQLYTGKLSSKAIKKIFQKDTYDLYSSIASEVPTKDADFRAFLSNSLSQLNMSLTFSDAEITYGVYDGKLVCWKFETGGLGNTLTISKQLNLSNLEVRELPDFSSAISYTNYLSKEYQNNVNKSSAIAPSAESENTNKQTE
jgi:hypothetical protein